MVEKYFPWKKINHLTKLPIFLRTIGVPPDIINDETSTDVSVQELDNVTLSCTATGHPPPKITWRREDHELMLLKKIGGRDFYKVAPSVIVPNQLLGAPLGTDVVLECTVEAYPNTINYWVKNRGEMLLDGPKYTITEERSSYKDLMKLTIRQFSKNDIGTYNCVSTNSLGKSEGTLRLYEIKLYPSSQSAAEVNIGGE
ncbi:unnamed protein product [Diatraea saccharalis]|uniref:Ig-like domain-containing protein n=1 Tax=Diatraea saccharalis TaxID=40085 RepID=A0A9N9WHB8_9NEOP|nr:unnamed protein product [Diatraea saccharalis]